MILGEEEGEEKERKKEMKKERKEREKGRKKVRKKVMSSACHFKEDQGGSPHREMRKAGRGGGGDGGLKRS